jgi:ABC-type phosphate transport system auxiliary subunit
VKAETRTLLMEQMDALFVEYQKLQEMQQMHQMALDDVKAKRTDLKDRREALQAALDADPVEP